MQASLASTLAKQNQIVESLTTSLLEKAESIVNQCDDIIKGNRDDDQVLFSRDIFLVFNFFIVLMALVVYARLKLRITLWTLKFRY
jgi:hypothetical protein